MTFPGFCPQGTRFGWTSLDCVPTAFSLPSLLEEKFSPMSEPPESTSPMKPALVVGGLLLAMAAAAAVGVAAANRKTESSP